LGIQKRINPLKKVFLSSHKIAQDRVMEEETRRRLAIAPSILGFIILVANGVAVIGDYLVRWSIPSLPSVAIGVVFLVVGLATANKRRQI